MPYKDPEKERERDRRRRVAMTPEQVEIRNKRSRERQAELRAADPGKSARDKARWVKNNPERAAQLNREHKSIGWLTKKQ